MIPLQEENNENLLPEFIYSKTIGQVANKHSQISSNNESILISVNNIAYEYDAKSFELINEIIDNKTYKITALLQYDQNYILGYENGIIKMFDDKNIIQHQFRPFSKRVTQITKTEDDYLIISSADGSLIKYDICGSSFISYINSVPIYNFKIENENIFLNCSDNTIKVFKFNCDLINNLFAFDYEIVDFIVFDGFILIFFINGETEIFNYELKTRKKFDTFRKIKSIETRENLLFVLTSGKLFLYKIRKVKNDIHFQNAQSFKIDENIFNLKIIDQSRIIVVYKNNKVEIKKIGLLNDQYNLSTFNHLEFHENELIDILVLSNRVISFSQEKFIVWFSKNDSLEKNFSVVFDLPAHSIRLINNNILVCFKSKIILYNNLNGDMICELSVENELSCFSNDILFLAHKNTLKLFRYKDQHFYAIQNFEFDENITFMNISNNNIYYALAFLNNNVHIYNFLNHDLKLTLYGHSLPVKYLEFSPDSKRILTCGADKLIKMWGTDFGECQKSFIGNAKNLNFINNESFIFCDEKIKYYKKHTCIKEYRGFENIVVKYGVDFMIIGMKYGLKYYKIGDYAFEFYNKYWDEEDEEIEIEMLNNKIVNYSEYERFLEELEKIENGDENYFELFNVMKNIDACEIDKFVYFLTNNQVRILITCLDIYWDSSSLVASRYLLCILRIHYYICRNDEKIYEIYNKIKRKIKDIRNEIGVNLTSLSFN